MCSKCRMEEMEMHEQVKRTCSKDEKTLWGADRWRKQQKEEGRWRKLTQEVLQDKWGGSEGSYEDIEEWKGVPVECGIKQSARQESGLFHQIKRREEVSWEGHRELHCVFVFGVETASDRRGAVHCMRKTDVAETHVRMVQDMRTTRQWWDVW